MTQEYDNAIKAQKDKIKADQNNMSVVMGTSWRLRSANAISAVNSVLDKNQATYNELLQHKDRDIQRLAEDLKYNQTVLNNEYNDKISNEMQTMLKNIASLDATGAMSTTQWLFQARSFIDQTINNSISHSEDYYNKLSYLAQRKDAMKKEKIELNKPDDALTKQMNDGFIYNQQGLRIVWADWQPLQYNKEKEVILYVKIVIFQIFI